MIFRNTFKLVLTNFSSVWKVLVYYIICILLTGAVFWTFAYPIVENFINANIFDEVKDIFPNIFNGENVDFGVVFQSFNGLLSKAWGIISSSFQFSFNFFLFIFWIFLVFPFLLDLAQLTLGEMFYGYMTSQVRYSFTGRFIKNIRKSILYSLSKYIVQLFFNMCILLLSYFIFKFFIMRSFVYILLNVLLICLLVVLISLKYSLFACWMPAIAVLDLSVFSGFRKNIKIVFKNFLSIFSNCLTLVLIALVVNIIFGIYSLGVALIISLPLTAVVFVLFQMVSYFYCQGMRFYVYPDLFVSPKRFEEQDKIKKVKFII